MPVQRFDRIADFAAGLGLGKAEDIELTSLSGGVSSDVWLAQGPLGSACIKQALATLRVAQRWDVPIERGGFEAKWLETASSIVPDSVPRLLGYAPQSQLIGMTFYPPDAYPNWRNELMRGQVDPEIAEKLGHVVGSIHAATADRSDIAARFQSDALFDALRLDPYFRSLFTAHGELHAQLNDIIEQTAVTRKVLVHGDVSPKNVLAGSTEVILVDAECAWFGDPAFDVAFLCTHLLLKMQVIDGKREALQECFTKYLDAYASHVAWEPLDGLMGRAARLLAAMLLARIDGKSPVDYLSSERRDQSRKFALAMLNDCPSSPNELRLAWQAQEAR